jgi:hypothetical protein
MRAKGTADAPNTGNHPSTRGGVDGFSVEIQKVSQCVE